jgi:hypothetical protein
MLLLRKSTTVILLHLYLSHKDLWQSKKKKVLKFGNLTLITPDIHLLILSSLIFLNKSGNFNPTKFRIKF